MAQARTKGKIHNSEWPNILQRHVSGETIADIARSYHCTAPAIRYIVRRSTAAAEPSNQALKIEEARPLGKPEAPEPFRAAAVSHGTIKENSARHSPQEQSQAPRALNRDLVRKANGDIAAFIVALNAADTNLDVRTVEDLREATDRLLQSCARTRLEIERIFPYPAS